MHQTSIAGAPMPSRSIKKGFGWLRHEVHDFQAVLAGGLKQLLGNVRRGDTLPGLCRDKLLGAARAADGGVR